MRVALIGAGRIGRLHARILASLPGVDGVIVADAVPAAAQSVADEVGGVFAGSAEEAMAGADAVAIAAATDAHAGLLRLAIGLRKPSFIEKPLAFDLDQTRELVDLAESSGVPVQLGFQRRFDVGYVEARRMVAAGEMGVIYIIRLIAHDDAPPPEAYIPTSGGLFRDSSIHDFDALRFITGQEVEDVYAVGAVRGFEMFAKYGDIDTGAAILRLTDGTIATLTQTRDNPRGYDIRMEIVGSRDTVSIGLGSHTPTRPLGADAIELGQGWDGFLTRFEPAYRAELTTFLEVARGAVPSPCLPRDGYEATRIAIAATTSLREARSVRIDEIH